MIVQFIHLILLCCGCTEFAGYAAQMPYTALAIWLFFTFFIIYYALPTYTQHIINRNRLPVFFKTYNIFCIIIVIWISLLFVFVNPIAMFINDDLAKFSSLNIFLSMIIYLLLLKPFMFSLYEMLQSILPDEETKEDFLRARQTVAIIFFPPILMWLLLEDMGLSEGMELMSEIKTLTIAPLFLFTLYILSPKLFNWAWRIKEASVNLVIRLKNISDKAQTKIAGVKIWNTFNEPVPNAAVAGILSQFRFVYITDFLLDTFTEQQIDAVVAHELGHLKLGHVVTYLIFSINAILMAILAKSILIIYFPYFYIHSTLTYTLEIIIFVPVFAIVFTALARHCELQADTFAVAITNQESFISSMNVLNILISPKPKWFPKWLLTHPETDDRIENIKNKTNLEINSLIKSSKVLKYSLFLLAIILVLIAINPVSIVFNWSNLYNASQAGNCNLVTDICNSLPEWLREHPFVMEQKVRAALNSGNYVSALIISFKAYFGVNLVSVLQIPHHSGSPEVALDFKVMQLILKLLYFR